MPADAMIGLTAQRSRKRMALARHLAPTICALAVAPALASVPPGDPFYVWHGQSVELAPGLKLKFIDVNDGRCPAGDTCVWQGEAFVEVELQFKGQTGRGTITTEKPEGTVLAHRVKLLGVYPPPGEGVRRTTCVPTGSAASSFHTSTTVPDCAA